MNKFWAKAFVILLAVILFFTVVSRAADSFLVAQVSVEPFTAKKIEHIVSAVASAEKGLEFPVMTEAGLLVRTVYVQEGEFVEAGTVLAEVDLEQLAETERDLRDEIRALQLQNEAAEQNQAAAREEKEKRKKRAQEDYERAQKKQEEALRRGEEELQQAEDAIDSFSAGGAEGMTQEEADTKKAELWQAYFEKKRALQDTEETMEEAVTAAARALEDAGETGTADNSAEINSLSIAQKEESLKVYEKLAEEGGKIMAETAGTVTGVLVQTGQKTTDTAAFTMTSTEGGARLSAEISKEDARYVEVGDAVTVEKSGKKYEDFSVTGIKQTEGGAAELTITSEGYAESFPMGESAEITVTKQSEVYNTAVPLTAVHTEQNSTYVYVAEQKSTVLGKQYFTRKVEVKILEKNSSYAALEDGVLNSENLIVTDSDTYLQAGDRVRLRQQ